MFFRGSFVQNKMGKKKNRNGPKIQQPDRDDPKAVLKNKQVEREQKERDIVDKFEERQRAKKPAGQRVWLFLKL